MHAPLVPMFTSMHIARDSRLRTPVELPASDPLDVCKFTVRRHVFAGSIANKLLSFFYCPFNDCMIPLVV